MRRTMKLLIMLTIAVNLLLMHNLWAGEADITNVRAQKSSSGTFRFDVTVQHADTGWGHYADMWEVFDPSGKVLGTRVLHHPHVEEQPFTRSLSGVNIPKGVKQVTVRAHDKVHGWGGATLTVDLP